MEESRAGGELRQGGEKEGGVEQAPGTTRLLPPPPTVSMDPESIHHEGPREKLSFYLSSPVWDYRCVPEWQARN